MSTNKEEKLTVIFLHIPKTAGSTLHKILCKQYSEPTRMHLVGNPHIHSALATFKALPAARRAKIQFLTGHIEYGIHQWLPQPATYITLLRHPVERVLSYYYFILRTPDHPRHEEMICEKIDVATFARQILTDNNQTRMLAGAWLDEERPCTAATLVRAKQNLQQHFAVVGLTERFDDTLLLLQKRLNWPSLPLYKRRNVTSNRPGSDQLSPDTLAAIRDRHQYDLALYAYAKAHFQETLRRQGAAFTVRRLRYRLQRAVHDGLVKWRKFSVRQTLYDKLENNSSRQ